MAFSQDSGPTLRCIQKGVISPLFTSADMRHRIGEIVFAPVLKTLLLIANVVKNLSPSGKKW
jgi:hypothetical protein